MTQTKIRSGPMPMARCPACWEASPPEPGTRCTGVREIRCYAFRCPCGALCRGLVDCPACGEMLPVDILEVLCDLPECTGSRGAELPAVTARLLVDRNGTGSVWVSSTTWTRLLSPFNRHAEVDILEAVDQADPIPHRIVGCYQPLRKGGPPPTARGAVVDIVGRSYFLGFAKKVPFWNRSRPDADIKVEFRLEDLLRTIEELQEAKAEINKWAEQVDASWVVRPNPAKVAEVEANLAEIIASACRSGRMATARLDIPDVTVARAARLLRQSSLNDERKDWWPAAQLDGRTFCGGDLCPGLGWEPSDRDPHPETCRAPAQTEWASKRSCGHVDPRLFRAALGLPPLHRNIAAIAEDYR